MMMLGLEGLAGLKIW